MLAWLLLLAGLGCGIAGVLLRTVLAPPDHIETTAARDDPGVAVVSAPGLLDLSGQSVQVSASGTHVFLGVARADDVTAWLADAAHTEVTGVAGDVRDPRARTTTSGSGVASDPRLADIWLATSTGEQRAQLTWSRSADRGLAAAGGVVVLAATDGKAAAPHQVLFSWAAQGRAARHPAGVPLIVGGGALTLIGVLGVVLRAHPDRRTPVAPA
ncbi:MAG: hypothetical protein ACRYF3_10685 [Janthinobacterium lividum]